MAINYTGTTNRSEFSYDGLSRCVKILEKTSGNVTSTRKFVWNGMERCEYRDGNDAPTLFLYQQGQHSGTTPYFYTRDHLGSIREMTSSSGTVVARYDYDPYGRSTSVISTTLPDLNFTGLYRHAASNLDLAVYRAYDPDLGRWLNRDPLPGTEFSQGLNLYAYVKNRVANNMDPSGENSCDTDEDCRLASGTPDEEANKRIRNSKKLLDDWIENYFNAFLGVGGKCWRAAKGGKYLIDIAIADAKKAIREKLETETKRKLCRPSTETEPKK